MAHCRPFAGNGICHQLLDRSVSGQGRQSCRLIAAKVGAGTGQIIKNAAACAKEPAVKGLTGVTTRVSKAGGEAIAGDVIQMKQRSLNAGDGPKSKTQLRCSVAGDSL